MVERKYYPREILGYTDSNQRLRRDIKWKDGKEIVQK
jgi:hypothetical protein